VGKDVACIGYSVFFGIVQYTAKMIVLQLVSENMSEASDVDPGEEFVLSC
jgi:hypothetical protein